MLKALHSCALRHAHGGRGGMTGLVFVRPKAVRGRLYTNAPICLGAKDRFKPPSCKIVSTIGPTSEQYDVLKQLVDEGVRVMRLNFSHATVEEADLRIKNLRRCKGRAGLSGGLEMEAAPDASHENAGQGRNLRAVLLDTRGPEIRTLPLENDESGIMSVPLSAGEKVIIRSDTTGEKRCKGGVFYVNLDAVEEKISVGDLILLDDGKVVLSCTAVEGAEVVTSVAVPGTVRSRVGVNLPGVKTGLPAMSEKDKQDIIYGVKNDIDYVAASFVRDREGVRSIRNFIRETVDQVNKGGVEPLVISKIENTEGLENFEDILDESDGIMVARGDLGVEIPIERVALEQKRMVKRCNEVGKPVIVATQMLESMTDSASPTRAEVSDVTNAVLDGADAVMLSGETAKGQYPVETVRAMGHIIKEAEGWREGHPKTSIYKWRESGRGKNYNSVAKGAVTASFAAEARCIIVLTKTGRTARLVSRYRPSVPIICYTGSYKVGRQLQLYRGCHPVVGLEQLKPYERGKNAVNLSKKLGFLKEGDGFILVTSESFYDEGGGNVISMKVGTVE